MQFQMTVAECYQKNAILKREEGIAHSWTTPRPP